MRKITCMPHWSGDSCADIDSKLDQLTHPNSDRYHPTSPGPVQAGTAVGSLTSPATGIWGCAFGITLKG